MSSVSGSGGRAPSLSRAHQPPDQRCIKCSHAHRVLKSCADIANTHLYRRIGVGGADIPPQLAAVLDVIAAPILCEQPVILRPRAQTVRVCRFEGDLQRLVSRQDLNPVSRPSLNGEDVDRAWSNGRYRRIAVIARMRVCASPNPAWMCMPPIRKRRKLSWCLITNSIIAFSRRGRLRLPPCKGMGGGGHHRRPVPFGRRDDDTSGSRSKPRAVRQPTHTPWYWFRSGYRINSRTMLVRPTCPSRRFRRCPDLGQREDRGFRGFTRKNSSSTPSIIVRSSRSATAVTARSPGARGSGHQPPRPRTLPHQR